MRFIIITSVSGEKSMIPLRNIHCVSECESIAQPSKAQSAIRLTPFGSDTFLLTVKDSFNDVIGYIMEASK